MNTPQPLYVVKWIDGRYELRQWRYRQQFFEGHEHPEDVLLTTDSARAMSEWIDAKYPGQADKSALSIP